jgi:hypothetical protein
MKEKSSNVQKPNKDLDGLEREQEQEHSVINED